MQKLQGRCPNAKLLYVTTTPVPTNRTEPSQPGSTHLLNSDVEAINAAAKQIMAEHRVQVLDMYSFVTAHCGAAYEACDWQGSGSVHFTTRGWRAMARHLAAAVLELGDSK